MTCRTGVGGRIALLATVLSGGCKGTIANSPALGVIISTPAPGDRLTGVVEVRGTARGDVAAVAIGIDAGGFEAAAGTAIWSYTLDTTALAAGAHRILARATDRAGQTAVATVDVVVDDGGTDGEPPVITDQPQDATVTAGEPAAFSVAASGEAPLGYPVAPRRYRHRRCDGRDLRPCGHGQGG